jgi:hypothetical protein
MKKMSLEDDPKPSKIVSLEDKRNNKENKLKANSPRTTYQEMLNFLEHYKAEQKTNLFQMHEVLNLIEKSHSDLNQRHSDLINQCVLGSVKIIDTELHKFTTKIKAIADEQKRIQDKRQRQLLIKVGLYSLIAWIIGVSISAVVLYYLIA